MGRSRKDRDDDRDREEHADASEDEATAARDFVMARMMACRAALAGAVNELDEAAGLFLAAGDEDPTGSKRAEALEAIDELVGIAARAVQAAQTAIGDIDPKEEEPELDDDED